MIIDMMTTSLEKKVDKKIEDRAAGRELVDSAEKTIVCDGSWNASGNFTSWSLSVDRSSPIVVNSTWNAGSNIVYSTSSSNTHDLNLSIYYSYPDEGPLPF